MAQGLPKQALGSLSPAPAQAPGEEPLGDFNSLYERNFPRVYNYVRYRIRSPDLADDLTAQTFTKALERLGRFDPERGSFTTWLLAIARNCVNDQTRRSRRWKWVPFDPLRSRSPDPDPEDALVTTERRKRVLDGLGRLDERDRDILGLKFAGQRSNNDIARLMGLKESHVAVLVFRAVRKLRSEIEGEVRRV